MFKFRENKPTCQNETYDVYSGYFILYSCQFYGSMPLKSSLMSHFYFVSDLFSMIFDTIFTIYYVTYFTFSFAAHCFVLYLIVWHSPSSLREMKKLMVSTSMSQILMCSSAFLTQVRMVPIQSSIALLSFGPCSLAGPFACLTTYNILNTSGCLVVASLLHMMYCRKILLNSGRISTKKFAFQCVVVYFLSVIVLIFSFLGPLNFDFIHDLVITSYPDINIHNYTVYGFSDVSNFFCFSAVAIIAAHAYIPPIVALFWRRKIVKEINIRQALFSARTQLQTRSFVQCLTWQTCVPLFFSILPNAFYMVQQLLGIGFTISEYLILSLNTFPAAMDPVFVIFFIKPYQNRAKSIISQIFGISSMGNSVSGITVSSQVSKF